MKAKRVKPRATSERIRGGTWYEGAEPTEPRDGQGWREEQYLEDLQARARAQEITQPQKLTIGLALALASAGSGCITLTAVAQLLKDIRDDVPASSTLPFTVFMAVVTLIATAGAVALFRARPAATVTNPLQGTLAQPRPQVVVRTSTGTRLPVRLEPLLGSSRQVAMWLAVGTLIAGGIVAASVALLAWPTRNWNAIVNPFSLVAGVAGGAMVNQLARHGRLAYARAETIVEIGAEPVERGQSIPIYVAQHGKLTLEQIEVTLKATVKTRSTRRNLHHTLHQETLQTATDLHLSGAAPWEFSGMLQIPKDARQSGEHDVQTETLWSIEVEARPANLPPIRQVFPFQVR